MIKRASAAVALVMLSSGCGNQQERWSIYHSATTSCVTLVATADALLSNPPMDQNFGGLPILRAGGKDESLVAFDLASIPASAVVDSAALELFISGSDSTSPVNVHRATTSWLERSTTFASFGQRYDAAILGAIVTTSVNVQKSVDLTGQVRSWVTGSQPNDGLLLETSSTKKTIFVSREGGIAEQKPQLQVCYTTPADHCSPNPCQNGATCENGSSSYTCHCPPGYSGTTCATVIDNCLDAPCLNGGVCANAIGGYTCTCPAGYTGTNCETLVDNCASAPCQNGGICVNAVATYSCQCPPGYTGTSCETRIDNCAAQPCQNGATCTNTANGYTCACRIGFTGASCEINIDDCAGNPCQNGGTCIDGINAYTCNCPPDWGGATCSVDLNSCSQHPCLNGGTCSNGVGTYTCTCPAGYSGANCEVDINDCSPNPCQNGGVCVDGIASYSCQCVEGYTGVSCETAPALRGSLVANPTTATANGSAVSVLTLTLVDGVGHPSPGQNVVFTVVPSTGARLTLSSATTDINGQATAALSSTKAETKTVTATFSAGSASATVTFVAGPPAASTSTLFATPTTVPADGFSTTTLTLTVNDAQANPVAGVNVTLSSTGSRNTLTPASGMTDSQGQFTATLSSTMPETKTVTASIPGGFVARSVTFTASNCAQGWPAAPQVFDATMHGCPGSVSLANRTSACAAAAHVCTAQEWVNHFGTQAPTHHYWTNDALSFQGSANSCSVWPATANVGTACPTSEDMLVCAPTTPDPEGNVCAVGGCGLESVTPDEYFGGCATTAGVLCCRN